MTKTAVESTETPTSPASEFDPAAVGAPNGRPPERDIRYRRPAFLRELLRPDNYRKLGRVATLIALDASAIYLAILTAISVRETYFDRFDASTVAEAASATAPLAILVTVLLFARSGLYGRREARPGFSRVFAALFQTAVLLLVFAWVSGERFNSYYLFYGSLVFALAYVSLLRYGYEKATGAILRRLGYKRRAVLVGSPDHIEAVAHAFENGGSQKYDTLGFVSVEDSVTRQNGLRSLGQMADLPRLLEEHLVDEVILADHDFPDELAVELVDRCHERGVDVRIAPSTMELLVHQGEFVPGEPVPLFEVRPPVFEGVDYVTKRAFDFLGAAFLLLVLSPALLAIAAGIKITSRGPILYRSVRPGIWGQPFPCLKFRTMHMDADHRQAELEERNEATGALFKIKDDPRMTAIGRWLRRYSLDELPQLWNVLKGEMSLVGPRPLPMRDYDRLEDWHKKRYLVLPGITGLWQVSGRSDLEFDDLVRLDFLYLERWSIFLDVTIMLKTVPAVFTRRGAY